MSGQDKMSVSAKRIACVGFHIFIQLVWGQVAVEMLYLWYSIVRVFFGNSVLHNGLYLSPYTVFCSRLNMSCGLMKAECILWYLSSSR